MDRAYTDIACGVRRFVGRGQCTYLHHVPWEKGKEKRRKRKTWRIEVRRLRASKGVLPRSLVRRRAARPIVRVEWFYFPTSSAWRRTEITVKWSSSTFRDRSTKDQQGWRGSPPSAGLDYHAGHGHESQVTENRVRPVWRLPTRSFFLLSSSFLTFFASHSCLLSFSCGTHVAFSLSRDREREPAGIVVRYAVHTSE